MKTRPVEPIYAALFAMLDELRVSGDFKYASRKLEHVNDFPVENMPALFTNQTPIKVSDARKGLPKNYMGVDVYVYVPGTDSEQNATALNNALDLIVAKLTPQFGTKQTLGGLVEDCYVEGTIEMFEGVLQDRAATIIPVVIVAPGF